MGSDIKGGQMTPGQAPAPSGCRACKGRGWVTPSIKQYPGDRVACSCGGKGAPAAGRSDLLSAAGVRAVFVRPGGRLEYRTVEDGRRSIRLPAFRLNDPPAPSSFNVPAEDYQWIGQVCGSALGLRLDGQLSVYALEGSGYKLSRFRLFFPHEMIADPAVPRWLHFDRVFADPVPRDADQRTTIDIAARVLARPDGIIVEAWAVARSIEHVIIHGIPGGSKPAGLVSGRSVSRGGGR